jgi:hypothetical protein
MIVDSGHKVLPFAETHRRDVHEVIVGEKSPG